MEAAAVSAATGALKPVLGKLGALLGDEYKRFKGVRKDIKALKYELAAMDAFLMNMSEEEDPDVQERAWMNEVRELSYFLEDCIDDFMQSVGDNDAKPDESFMERIKRSLGKLGKMKARRRIGNEIHDLKKQIIEVGERNQRYKTREPFSSTKNATIDTRALAMFEDASKLVGIDEPKAEIIKLLTQQDGRASPQQHPKLVSIVGSGGMGKTTLANQVYQELRGQFECHAFLPVSRNPDMKNILRTILSQVSGQGYAATEAGSIEQLITKIKDFLADKRYFVVVDDIWDVAAWDIIKPAFPMTSSGSIIITTTRINDVAKSCRSSFGGDIYGIRPLNMVHSTQLFHRRLFDSKEDLPSHLEQVSDQILQKCDGLPLAIITISGLLANRERTEDLWNQVKDSIGRALERDHGVKRMMKILSLSYFDLPPHLKSCLLYMSIFPEDSIIKRKALIRRWIGEGFIHKEGRYSVYEIGERCFNELLNRGLIQPGQTDGCDEMTSCRVHDTILDFIISKSIEENFVALLGVPNLPIGTQSKVARRLSLQDVKQGNSTILTAGLVLSHVRSLNVFGHSIEIPCMEEFTHLHVLDLKHCDRVKDHHLENIVKLFQLRYLNLGRTGIRKLPEQIGNLGCLEMLNIRHTMVKELPASIVDLRELSHLLVDFKVKFPDGIAKMQALETLKEVMASKQSLDFLSGLGQLKNLRNLVLVEWVGTDMYGVEECTKAIVSSLCKLGTQNLLRSLTIQDWGGLLQEPLSLLTLEKLIVQWASVPQVPEWIRSLRNLQQLHLTVKLLQVYDLCILGSLPTLLILNLTAYSGKDESFRISGEIGFRCLRKFSFHANNCDFGVTFPAGSMPKLEILRFFRLSIYEAEPLDVGIENLPSLSYVLFDCNVYGDDQKEAVKASMERAVSRHPKHPSLVFCCRSNLCRS